MHHKCANESFVVLVEESSMLSFLSRLGRRIRWVWRWVGVFIGSCCSYGVSSGSRGVEGVLVYVLYKYVVIL